MTNKKKRLPPSSPIFYQDPPNHQYGQWKSHIYFDDFASDLNLYIYIVDFPFARLDYRFWYIFYNFVVSFRFVSLL